MTIQWWQILLITIYAGFAFYDGNNTTFGTVKPTMAGFFAGLVLGDVTTGLVVGGTLNLLVLGIGNFGGASIPDYMTGALLGTAFAIQSGQGAEFGVTLADPHRPFDDPAGHPGQILQYILPAPCGAAG